MSASDVEDLLAGLSEPEEPSSSREDNKSTGGNDFDTLVAEINRSCASLITDYANRLQTLRELLLTPRELVDLVKIVGNDTKLNEVELQAALGHERTVRLCIYAAEHGLRELDADTYAKVWDLALHLESLLAKQAEMLAEFRGSAPTTSPNVSRLVDTDTAALLVLKAGGVRELAKMPASNLVNPKTSVLAKDAQIRAVPESYRRQALRILAGKLVLAARLDAQQPPKLDESAVQSWKRNVEHRISKLLEPPPSLQHRALPKPVDKRSTRRGGKRLRKQKQKRQAEMRTETVRFGLQDEA